jgi:protein SCO1/2
MRLRPVVVLAAFVLAACGGGAERGDGPFQAAAVDRPSPRPSFTLTDTAGGAYDFAERTAGRPTLLFFGYTHCPDICPVHLANVQHAFDVRPDLATGTEVVFVTVDPDRDTPDRLRSYLDRFDQRFVGLTGTPDQIRDAQDAAGLPPAGVDVDDPEVFGHAAQMLGYGADDRLHVQFPAQTRSTVFAHDLAVLVAIPPAAAMP